MRGVEFVGWGFVMLVTLFSVTVLPYLVLFGLRKRERAGCGSVVLVVLVAGLIGGGIGLAFRPTVVAALAVPRIQAALDEQCGGASETVTADGFTMLPYYSWLGEDAGCQYIDFTASWECYCVAESP